MWDYSLPDRQAQYRAERMAEAALQRLIQRVDGPTITSSILFHIGRALIWLGQRLTARETASPELMEPGSHSRPIVVN